MTEQKQSYGLTVTGNIRVFSKSKEITGANKAIYTVTDVWFNVSEKEEDGTFFNRSINLIFPRNTDKPSNNSIITIKDSNFMITGNGEYRRISLFVKEWSYAETSN